MPPYHLGIKTSLWACFIPYLEDNQTCVYRQVGASEFSGMEWWNGMVEWNGGMEWWNGMVEWNGGMEWWNGLEWWTGMEQYFGISIGGHLFIKTTSL